MKVLLADERGFCFGVERAVDMVEDALDNSETVRTLGPLIHNNEEMGRLNESGVTTISEPVQIKRGETAVIRAHGVTPEAACSEQLTASLNGGSRAVGDH